MMSSNFLNTLYFPGFVYFVLYKATISGERLQDHWSSVIVSSDKKHLPLVKHFKEEPTIYVLYRNLHFFLKAYVVIG